VALQLLETSPDKLHVTALKIRTKFTLDLVVAAETGKLNPIGMLNAVLRLSARLLRADVGLNESINSTIKMIAEAAPAISLELLSSRVSLRKQMAFTYEQWERKKGNHDVPGHITRLGLLTWKKLRPVAVELLKSTLLHADNKMLVTVQTDEDRWCPPGPAVIPKPQHHNIDPSQLRSRHAPAKVKEMMRWVAALNRSWCAWYKTHSVEFQMIVLTPTHGDAMLDESYTLDMEAMNTSSFFFCADESLGVGRLISLVLADDVDQGPCRGNTVAKFPELPNHITTWSLFWSLYGDALETGASHILSALPIVPKQFEDGHVDVGPDGVPKTSLQLAGNSCRICVITVNAADKRKAAKAKQREEAGGGEAEPDDIDHEEMDGMLRAEYGYDDTGDGINDDLERDLSFEIDQLHADRADAALFRKASAADTMPSGDAVRVYIEQMHDQTYDVDDLVRNAAVDLLRTGDASDALPAGAPAEDDGPEDFEVTDDLVQDLLRNWLGNIRVSTAALQDRERELKAAPLGRKKEMSLMLYPSLDGVAKQVGLVAWVSEGDRLRRGRCVTLDDNNACVYPSAWTCKPRDFGPECQIVHPAVRERVKKVSADERPILGGLILQLLRMYEASLAQDLEISGDAHDNMCVACDGGYASFRCPICLMRWHKSCYRAAMPACLDFLTQNGRLDYRPPHGFTLGSIPPQLITQLDFNKVCFSEHASLSQASSFQVCVACNCNTRE
jgi:hypothetical protein